MVSVRPVVEPLGTTISFAISVSPSFAVPPVIVNVYVPGATLIVCTVPPMVAPSMVNEIPSVLEIVIETFWLEK